MSDQPAAQPVRFECTPWEVRLILRLRQLRQRRQARQILLDLPTLTLYPVGSAEALDRCGSSSLVDSR